MKIKVFEKPEIKEIEVVINCQEKNEQVTQIKNALTYLNKSITGKLNGKTYQLPPNKIYYFESIDNRVYAYTKVDVFQVALKLYQLEDILANTPYIRINKNTILNTRKIKTFHMSINGRMKATLVNQEKVVISRKYVPVLRHKLGGKR